MSTANLSHACDQLLSLLQHEFGIPQLWPEVTRSSEDLRPELDYFALAAVLAHKLDRVVYLNCMQRLVAQDRPWIESKYTEIFDTPIFRSMSNAQIRRFLLHMAAFKNDDLAPLLASALPVLRLIFLENQTLTNAELSVLNNLKKAGSAYNAHPANIRPLMAEYERSLALLSAVAHKDVDILSHVRHTMAPLVGQLHSLAAEHRALDNTFQNQFGAGPEDKRLRTLLRDYKKLERKTRLLSILSDLLPQMVLCLPTNWYEDERLHAIILDCLELLEKLAEVPRVSSMHDALSTEYECGDL